MMDKARGLLEIWPTRLRRGTRETDVEIRSRAESPRADEERHCLITVVDESRDNGGIQGRSIGR